MITEISNLPPNMVGFKASGEITEADFSDIVMPRVKELIEQTNKLNYMLVLDTSISNFTFGAWFKDAVMGVKHLLKWNRCAIVSDVKGIRTFTDIFSVVMPGEFRGFEHAEEQQAVDWCSEKIDL
jgi:hypothetical protein